MGHVPKLIYTLSGLFDNFLSNPTRFEYGKSGQTWHFECDCLTWITAVLWTLVPVCVFVAFTPSTFGKTGQGNGVREWAAYCSYASLRAADYYHHECWALKPYTRGKWVCVTETSIPMLSPLPSPIYAVSLNADRADSRDESTIWHVCLTVEPTQFAFGETPYEKGLGIQHCTASLRAGDSLVMNGRHVKAITFVL